MVPRDIFHWIMSFIDPFPYYYFMLRSVCSQWLYEFQEQVYDQVRYLNLLDDGSPKYYFRGGAGEGQSVQNLVQFKPIVALGHKFRLSQLRHMMKRSCCLYESYMIDLAQILPPSVQTLKLIGFDLSNVNNLSHFLLFSKRGRLDRQASHILMADELTDSIECDVQHLNLEYSFMSEDAMHMFDEYKTIKGVGVYEF